MNILIVLCHPSPESFNHAIALKAQNRLFELGHKVIFHDLYKEKFDPVVEMEEIPKNGKVNDLIRKHCDDLASADGIIIIHPNWWGQPPAIMKGWIDRVIRPGAAYEFVDGDIGEGIPIGLLKAETAIIFNTSNTSEKRENEIFLDPLETIWKNCIFDLCGVKYFYRKMFRIIVTSSAEERKVWLDEVEITIEKYFSK
jgi:NAD(P)H dehydrogenase (quinone)